MARAPHWPPKAQLGVGQADVRGVRSLCPLGEIPAQQLASPAELRAEDGEILQ